MLAHLPLPLAGIMNVVVDFFHEFLGVEPRVEGLKELNAEANQNDCCVF